ncbi:MAG: hypothetical protein IJK25_04220 [Firmicutes bacterium]|nr:hypothetical protein [Bacillota bacterium]
MATELAQAYVQIVPSAQGIKGALTKELDAEAGDAGEKAGASLAGKLKGAITAAAVVGTIKSALDEGAALQQSYLGGLDTLYGESAETMRGFAREAAASGISMNSYAEQAVSFGAALNASLGNNTAAAAHYADMAIKDMADNAAKMGTDVQSLQNAYQGFAKGNYTMLDNLKLGYGGTKSEMERLLADAGKLPAAMGKKFDLSNLADVYEAIHLVQDNLGLTGVAAEEAAGTLSGSFGAMQAAAKNFMGSLVLGEDIQPALSELINSAVTFLFDNLLPAVGNILISLPDALGEFLDGGIDTLIDKVVQFITDYAPELIKGGIELMSKLIVGLLEAIPDLVAAIPDIVEAIFKAFAEVDWGEIGKSIIQGIGDALIDGIGSLAEAAKKLGNSLLNSVKGVLGIHSPSKVFQDEVGKMVSLGMAEGITDNTDAVSDSMKALTDAASASNVSVNMRSVTSQGGASYDDRNMMAAVYSVGIRIIDALNHLNVSGGSSTDRDIYSSSVRGQRIVGASLVQ